jgi:hypothetical protein
VGSRVALPAGPRVGGQGLPGLSALPPRDADGVRRGPGAGGDPAGRRAAGRPGGSRRSAVRGTRGARAGRGAGEGRPLAQLRLPDERGQTLQVRAARQEADPSEAQRRGARGVSSVALRGARGGAPSGDRQSRRDGGALPRRRAARWGRFGDADRDDPPFGRPPRSGARGPPRAARAPRPRSAEGEAGEPGESA